MTTLVAELDQTRRRSKELENLQKQRDKGVQGEKKKLKAGHVNPPVTVTHSLQSVSSIVGSRQLQRSLQQLDATQSKSISPCLPVDVSTTLATTEGSTVASGNIQVAVKWTKTTQTSQSVVQEYQTYKKLQGIPNVATVLGLAQRENHYGLVLLRYATTVDTLCQAAWNDSQGKIVKLGHKTDSFPDDCVKLIHTSLGAGLNAIHRKKVSHGDLKPANICVAFRTNKLSGQVGHLELDFGFSGKGPHWGTRFYRIADWFEQSYVQDCNHARNDWFQALMTVCSAVHILSCKSESEMQAFNTYKMTVWYDDAQVQARNKIGKAWLAQEQCGWLEWLCKDHDVTACEGALHESFYKIVNRHKKLVAVVDRDFTDKFKKAEWD